MGFTGIVQQMGTVTSVQKENNVKLWDGSVGKSFTLTVTCAEVEQEDDSKNSLYLDDQYIGASIAVDGVCLTVVTLHPDKHSFDVNVAGHTIDLTTLGNLQPSNKVNLEKALKAGSDISGHEVQGHVDRTIRITKRELEGDHLWLTFELPSDIAPLVVKKGYVAIDGISLTVARRSQTDFAIMMVPHTQTVVTLALKNVGERVNVEGHVLGKYVVNTLNGMGALDTLNRVERWSYAAIGLSAVNMLLFAYFFVAKQRSAAQLHR